jgi:hypothetical protein
MLQFVFILGPEVWILLGRLIGEAQFLQGGNQGFGDENSAIPAEMSAIIR